MTPDVLSLLQCPTCDSPIHPVPPAAPEGVACSGCGRQFALVNGILRFVDIPADPAGRRTQASFGYEWTHFNDWAPSGSTNFNDYFNGVDLEALASSTVLDAGCGMGRHARQIAQAVKHLVALDFSQAIDEAARNTARCGNVTCIQGDLLALPVRDEAFDFIYSLGVLHHLAETERAVASLVRKLKPGGRLRIYLYWKKHGWQRLALGAATLARTVTTRLPFPVLRGICWALSVGLSGLVIVPYRVLSALGFQRHQSWPLSVYAKYPFRVLYNDQFDRFSAPIEKRYDPDDVRTLLEEAGLQDVRIRACYGWVADGVKPS